MDATHDTGNDELTSAGPGTTEQSAVRLVLRLLALSKRACLCGVLLALDVNDRYKMQNPNNWYSLQRSNTDQHTYPIQDPASNTPTLTPTGAHNTQALPAVYSYATAARTTHGEQFCYCSIQSLIVYTTVARHHSHPSVGGHTPYAQPQYYSANGYHCPSPNPPPYTEYATELNRPQSLRRSEGESSYWTTVGGDTSRYHVGQSNR